MELPSSAQAKSAVQMTGNSLCWFGPGERAESDARLASRTSYISGSGEELPLRLRAKAKQKQRGFLMLAAPESGSAANRDWQAERRNGACSHEVERSEDRVMRRPYANGAQEQEQSEM